ncbi:hypothetical protein [Modicisalibacter sp. MOD 31.J]|uniref:hypothetical protein n=1 Tax=Modicisalibacter sp. MOD 31.J TaxID=2831897 RepID=UPI001CCB0646|nr:hypothetical protein [Modicisalibacter sp. MOD 31.J]MBZ9574555.1 hypothetical protein [Modicisalibacter sp. MOD 31.J]
MNKAFAKQDSTRLTETMTQPTREGVLASAHRLGGLIAQASKSDAERTELLLHAGRLIASGSDSFGHDAGAPTSDLNSERADVKQGPLEEVYRLILETVRGRDAHTLEQQLDALAVHLGALVASGCTNDAERGGALHRIESRMSHACLKTSRILAADRGE